MNAMIRKPGHCRKSGHSLGVVDRGRRGSLKSLAGITALTALGVGQAQEAYPAKPVQVIVAYPPSGGTDTLARLITAELTKILGQPFLVVNRPGASGAIGTSMAARAPADGYTLLLDTGNCTLRPVVEPRTPFKAGDFAPVALLTESPIALVVTKDLPVSSVSELIAYSKANPGKISYASTGAGSPQNMAGELLKVRAKLDWVQVSYQGGAPALIDLIAGRVQVMFSNPVPLMPYFLDRRLNALAVTSEERLPALNRIPTMAEQGQPDFLIGFWNGMLAPAGTPPAIVRRLSDALLAVMGMPHVIDALAKQGSVRKPLGTADFLPYIAADSDRWVRIAREIDYQPPT
jgi:tripartite-type tricarboxylate transporter receptor subunit TctC